MWVRLDDGFAQHPKVVAAGPLAMAMQVAGLCYANKNMTDGFIPWAVARNLLSWEFLGPEGAEGRRRYSIGITCGLTGDDVTCDFVISLLVSAGIWLESSGGYTIHDYLDYNPSRDEVLAARRSRAEAGRLGGKRSFLSKQSTKHSIEQSIKQAPSTAEAKHQANFNPVPVPVPVPDPLPVPGRGGSPTAAEAPPKGHRSPTEGAPKPHPTLIASTDGTDGEGTTAAGAAATTLVDQGTGAKPKTNHLKPIYSTTPKDGLDGLDRCRRGFAIGWVEKYGTQYPNQPEKDRRAAQVLLRHHKATGVAVAWPGWVKLVFDTYLAIDDDPLLSRERHPMALIPMKLAAILARIQEER